MNKSIRSMVWVLALWLAAGPTAGTTGDGDSALAKADQLLAAGDARGAVKAFKAAQKASAEPSFAATIGLAIAYTRMGAFKKGADTGLEAIDLATSNSDRAAAHNQRGLALMTWSRDQPEKLGEAIDAFRRALDLTDGTVNNTRFNLGTALLKASQDEEGVALLRAFLEHGAEGRIADRARALIDNPRRARVDLLPVFEAATLDGDYLESDDLLGKVVLFDFWGTWCKPCVNAVPHLRRLAKRREGDPFVLLSISNDGDEAVLRQFVEENQMTWPQIWDQGRALTGSVFEVRRFPTYILVDHEGEIVYRDSGWSQRLGQEIDRRVGRALRTAKKSGGAP